MLAKGINKTNFRTSVNAVMSSGLRPGCCQKDSTLHLPKASAENIKDIGNNTKNRGKGSATGDQFQACFFLARNTHLNHAEVGVGAGLTRDGLGDIRAAVSVCRMDLQEEELEIEIQRASEAWRFKPFNELLNSEG